MKKILFLGETYRADAQSWIEGIEKESKIKLSTLEVSPSNARWRRVMNLILFFIKIARVNFTKWDLVLAERSTSYGFFSLFINTKVRVVAQQGITDAYPTTGISGVIKRWLKSRVYRNVDLIHAWGHVMVPAMLNAGAPPSKILVLPKGINLKIYRDLPHTDIRGKKVGIVTRSLFPDYCHENILEAIQLVASTYPEIELWIVGDGILMSELKNKAIQLGIEKHVKFLGRISNNKLPELLAQSDFYLSVPISEGVSASLFEAMATNNFPIVSDLPANRAFIKDGVNGILVPVNNSTALADALMKYLLDMDSYKSALIQNRKFIENNVDFEKNMSVIFELYTTILKNK